MGNIPNGQKEIKLEIEGKKADYRKEKLLDKKYF